MFAVVASVGTLFAQSGTCGENLTWNLTGNVLTISGSGAMTDYANLSTGPWGSYRSSIATIIIGDEVTSIGNNAFHSCHGLTSVTIGNSVTSIGNYAFYKCSGLTSVTIPNSVTSIGNSAFYAVPNIVYNGTAVGSPWEARNINGYVDGYLVYSDDTKTTLTACFTSAQGDIVIPESVTSIGKKAFYECIGLTSVIIPESVTSIGEEAFEYCSGLTSVTIPNSVTSIGDEAFFGCNGLTSVTIPNSVTSIGNHAFYNCSGLTSVTIGEGVTSIGSYAFYSCSSLSKITLGKNIQTIRNGAFRGCSNLLEIHAQMEYPPVIDASVFDDCGDLSGIDCHVPQNSLAGYKEAAVWKEFNLLGTTDGNSGIDDISTTDTPTAAQKVIMNGTLYILTPDGRIYNTQGQEVK